MHDPKLWAKVLPSLLAESDFAEAFVKQLSKNCAYGVPDLIDCVREAFDETSEEVLQLYWEGSTPLSGGGSSFLRAVGDVCVCTSTDWEASGPYESIEEALANAETFSCATTDPGLLSGHLSDDELLRLARRLCPRESRAHVNGEEYGWKDGKFVPVEELEEEPEEDEEVEEEPLEEDEADEQEREPE